MTKISVEIQARRGLAAAHRLTVVEGYREGTWNHYSSNTRNSLTTDARAYHFSQVCASNLILMDSQGRTVSGELEPNAAAWVIHYPLQRARPDLTCLMHVHTCGSYRG